MRRASSARNVARLYLGMDRAIPYTAPYPASIGDHPGCNALLAIAADSTGQITGGQFIHLDRDGHKLCAHRGRQGRRAGPPGHAGAGRAVRGDGKHGR